MRRDEVTAAEVGQWYGLAATHLYGGVFYPTLWATRIPQLELAWERWIEDEHYDLVDDAPRIEAVEERLVVDGSFDEIVAFFAALPDEDRASAIAAMRAETAAMAGGTFRPCLSAYEIEDLYDFKGGPLFEEAWDGVDRLDEAFLAWAEADRPTAFRDWADAWPPDRRDRYRDQALSDLESRVRQGSAMPIVDFFATLPDNLARAATEAIADFRREYGG